MNNTLGLLLSDAPIKINDCIKLYQPTLRDIVYMTEERYNLILKIWTVPRKELIPEENEYTKSLDDLRVWVEYVISVPKMREVVEESCLVFFHKKIEFFPLTYTMYIGEGKDGCLLDLNLFLTIKTLFSKLDFSKPEKEDSQYKETDNMSERERRIYERMKAGEEKLNKIKYGDVNKDDLFGKQIVALVAIGHYTFKEVYDMTMLQFKYTLDKYIDIEKYELHTILSPYISSKDAENQENKHWIM